MPTSPDRRSGKRKGCRCKSKVSRKAQTASWRTFVVNASTAALPCGAAHLHLAHLTQTETTMLAVLAGTTLATWMNTRLDSNCK